MKVFFCETYTDGTVGGSHACMHNLIKHIDRSRMEFVAGFYASNSYVPRYRDLGVQVKILPFNNALRSGNVILRKALNWYRLEYKAQHYLENYLRHEGFDLVVLNNSLFTSLLFVRVCKTLGIPLIVYERGLGRFEKKHIKATRDIEASIPISDAVRRFLVDNNFRTRIIERIYDGLDPEGFTAQVRRRPEEIKNDLGIPQSGRVVGIIGNVRPWKGQRYFVDAFISLARHYDDIYGLVVGGWATEEDCKFQAQLKERVRNAGLEERVLFLGYRNDVPELLSIFDVFVHASTKPEPFGMVILEAMAAKKPVVATNLGGPIEILGNGECGILVPPKDGEAIAQACKTYLTDTPYRQKMVELAYSRLLMEYHIDKTIKETTELFEKVANSV